MSCGVGGLGKGVVGRKFGRGGGRKEAKSWMTNSGMVFFLFEISTVGQGILEDDSSRGGRGKVGVSRRTVSKRRTTVMGKVREG